MPSMEAQIAIFSTAAAGLSVYGATQSGMSDRTRLVTAGMAGIFSAASAMSGFKLWAAINAGAAIGTLASIPIMHFKNGSDDAKAGAKQVKLGVSNINKGVSALSPGSNDANVGPDAQPDYGDWIKTQYQPPGDQLLQNLQNHESNSTLSLRQRIRSTPSTRAPQIPVTQ